MKKIYRTIVTVFMGALLIGLGAGQGLAANPGKVDPSLHRDGSAFAKKTKITQADRQAAADRAKAKGFVVPNAGNPEGIPAAPGKGTPTERGANK